MTEAGTQKKKSRAKPKKNAAAEKNLPGWIWLVSGVVIGGFVSFIVYLKLNVPVDAGSNTQVSTEQSATVKKAEKKTEERAKEEKKPVKPNVAEKDSPKKQGDGELEFYKILTNREPLFPSNESNASTDAEKKTETQKQKTPTDNVEKTLNNKQEPKSKEKTFTYIYTLQVGSFLAFKDADKRKANLAMLGIGSRIHAIKNRNVTHYRVMVGPYDDLKRIQKIDSAMKENNIKTLLLKERG